jgi:uncharacterized protein YybS (DUF2232 family)
VNGLKTGYQSLMWSGAALLLLLSTTIPVLNILAIFLIMVPYVVLYTTLTIRSFAAQILVVWIAAYLIIGPVGPIIGMFFIVPAIVMGILFRKRAKARNVLAGVTITLLALFLLQLLVFTYVFDFSPIRVMGDTIRDSTEQLQLNGMLPGYWTTELTDSFVQTLTQSIPVALITVSFVYTVIAQWLSRRALRLSGVAIPPFRRAKDWMLPKIIVIYYLIIMVIDMLISKNDGSFMAVALLNLLPLLRFVFTIQAIGFLFYLAEQKRWNRAIPILLAIPVLLFPPLSLIGVLDVAFPIRKSFVKP